MLISLAGVGIGVEVGGGTVGVDVGVSVAVAGVVGVEVGVVGVVLGVSLGLAKVIVSVFEAVGVKGTAGRGAMEQAIKDDRAKMAVVSCSRRFNVKFILEMAVKSEETIARRLYSPKGTAL